MTELAYAELQSVSNFSFLTGASHPEELIHTAAALGYKAIAITDMQSLAGVVRGHIAAKNAGIRYIVGARLQITVDFAETELPITLLVYPTDRAAYGALCRLLTVGKRREKKGECRLHISEFLSHDRGLAVTIVPPRTAGYDPAAVNASSGVFSRIAEQLKRKCARPDLLSIALTFNYGNRDSLHLQTVEEVSRRCRIPLIAGNDVYYHAPERRPLQDVLTCIKHQCTIQQAGFLLFPNAERYLKPRADLQYLYRDHGAALERTIVVADACAFSLDQLQYEYPNEICPAGSTPLGYLRALTERGAAERYPAGIPDKVRGLIEQELDLIHELRYEKYFLTCYDIVAFARSIGVLCQGRGAAANSAVCYCLGITAVDPARIDLLFARFVSKERNEPPDIDIDFEHERREEVIQYIYRKYGRERAGLTAEVITYRHRSAIRDVGKALGLSLQVVDRLARMIHHWSDCVLDEEDLRSVGLDPADRTVHHTLAFTRALLSFPRHLSQHVGGFIISEKPLCETVPILNAAMEDRTIIEWDKDDIEALGMLKIDVLGLGMLTCIRKALEYLNRRRGSAGEPLLELRTIPAEDPAVYDMACAADTLGVFQIESRAQVSMLPRLRPRCFYDLVIEVAIVRPGPIQGNMLHPYLKRRNGLEQPYFPDERVRQILGKTLGIPIFQEQAMRLAIVLANFTPGEAEQLRRAMAAWKRNSGAIAAFQQRIMAGMTANGYSAEFAASCVEQIKGFSEYGFPESHAASFALLVYASAWLKRYYPVEFAAALLNSQPMGFYPPSQITQDVRHHGWEVRPIDVNYSAWDCTLEKMSPGCYALRLGMRLVKTLQSAQAELIAKAVAVHGTMSSVAMVWEKTRGRGMPLSRQTLEALAHADAFGSMKLSRREALWQIRALPETPLPLDALNRQDDGGQVALPGIGEQQAMFYDYSMTGLSLRAHPLSFVRDKLAKLGAKTARELSRSRLPRHAPVLLGGLAIFRQRPPTAKGTVFITLEDETGMANLIVRAEHFEQFKKLIISRAALLAYGKLERIGKVVYVSVEHLEELELMGEISSHGRGSHSGAPH